MTKQGAQSGQEPAEITEFLAKIGPRILTPDEARTLNLLRLKHNLPAAGVSGVAAIIAGDAG
jgi:hypothetical protein